MRSSHRARKGKCKRKIGFKGGWEGEGRSPRVLVNEGMKHRGNGGKMKGVVRKNKRGKASST